MGNVVSTGSTRSNITVDVVEADAAAMGTWRMIGQLPESVESDDNLAGLHIRVVDGYTIVSRSLNDATLVKARGFAKAMTALADLFACPVSVSQDHGVTRAVKVVGHYLATVVEPVIVAEVDEVQEASTGRAVVMVGRDGASRPIYRYRDELGLPDYRQTMISPADRARVEASISMSEAVTGALLADAQSWIDEAGKTLVVETPAEVRPVWDHEVRAADELAEDGYVRAEDACGESVSKHEPADPMDIILATVEGYSGALYTGAVTIPELMARGASRYAVSEAVRRGWVQSYGYPNEGTRVRGVYLTAEGAAERDRRAGAGAFELTSSPAPLPVRVPGESLSMMPAPMEGQSAGRTGVTRMKATVVIEYRPRVKGFNRRKPSCARRGWK